MKTRQNDNQPLPEEMPGSRQFLQVFNLLINSARIHHNNNQALILSVRQFVKLMQQLLRDNDDVTLLFSEGGFYLQEKKIGYEKNSAHVARTMLRFFEKRNLEGLCFNKSILEAPPDRITDFARLIAQSSLHEDPASWLEKKLAEEQLLWVKIVHIPTVSNGMESFLQEETKNKKDSATSNPVSEKKGILSGDRKISGLTWRKKKKALQTYGYTVLSLKDIARKIGSNEKASIKITMRLVQKMIDMVVDDNQIFLSLSTIRDYDDYTFTHSINVAILSASLGHKIGLPKSTLETLSLSALFHDLGKIDIPRSILNKPDRLTETEFQVIRQHSLDSVRRIIKLGTSRKKKISILLPPFEHHLKYDLSGYPKTPRKKPVSLPGRIIAIADVFDAITSPRIYRPTAISPDRALGYMLEKAGSDFDPLLLKVFINMIGVYPIGTLLRFANNELGLVAQYEEREKSRELWVQLLKPDGRGGVEKAGLVNLGSLDPKTGSFNRTVVETMHPADYGIQPAEFIM
ncbi:MAG: HD domain-containing protein [Desulfobulbaceae bacterium]|nr:HD domain-containing protein [Desulfobulbaceae bacterium]